MYHRYDGRDPQQRADGFTHALSAARRGELVVVHVDGAYGVITDAFSEVGIQRIVNLKERPNMSIPVLVPRVDTVDGLAQLHGESAVAARDLMRDCWPGALTLIADVQPSLAWQCTPDGTVALRMPLHPWTLQLVRELGPTACVPASVPGGSVAMTCDEAVETIGVHASVFLDGGPALPDQASTIVDVTGDQAVIVREGAFTCAYLERLVPGLG